MTMIRLQLISDLHLESCHYTLSLNPSADLIVIAGDIGPITSAVVRERARVLFEKLDSRRTILVLGNHDFYGNSIEGTMVAWRAFIQRWPNIAILDDNSFLVGGHVICGGTLWTDFALYPDVTPSAAMGRANFGITDFRGAISFEGRHLMPPDLPPMHKRCRESIASGIARGKPTIVITHFIPSPDGIHPQWRVEGKPLNPYFASNCEDLLKPNVAAWLFGHTHSSLAFTVGKTQFHANPRGYTDRENPKHEREYLITVSGNE